MTGAGALFLLVGAPVQLKVRHGHRLFDAKHVDSANADASKAVPIRGQALLPLFSPLHIQAC
jgi:hypothetical protein